MPRHRRSPALFFDFDNTLTQGDVLDVVIEAFSPNDAWRTWEREWDSGRLSARECLQRQVENLRVSRAALFDFLSAVRIDATFATIVDWSRLWGFSLAIVSDSFEPLIHRILENNGIHGVPVYANRLDFSGNRLIPRFPYADPGCANSANAKARHLLPFREHCVVFAGDGRTDLDAALAADVVFAKDRLAAELGSLGVPFQRFDTLAPVMAYLRREWIGAPRREAIAG
jgi:2-hydroxy-3-keto-5-methylthiopentenyl-1-phosphate phosphatase